MKTPTQHPMTLIELLIVLALLGGLATMALTGVGELSANNRVRVTRERLDHLRQAVVGDGLRAGRFLQDMGRFPMIQDTGDGQVLSELWGCPSGLAHDSVDYTTLNSSAGALDWPDSGLSLPDSVSMHCGWNGPYITLNADGLYDGFGNDFLVASSTSPSTSTSGDWEDAETAGTGSTIQAVLSLGADGDFTDADWADTNRMCCFSDQSADVELMVTVKGRDLSGDTPSWHALSPATVWGASTSYDFGDCVADSSLASVFQCTSTGGGTSDSSEPTWDATTPNTSTTTDNGITWTYLGPVADFPYRVNRLRVALFVPVIGQSSKSIGWIREWQSNDGITGTLVLDETCTMEGGVSALPPGLRKLYVYALLTDGSTTTNAHAGMAEPQEIMIEPGTNHVTVYLTQPLN